MERYLSDPPDGGYGWVVATLAFFIMGLTAAVLKHFGLFFFKIQSHYNVLTSTASWVTSTTIAVFHLGAPLASALSMHLSQRAVIMVGGFLAASGLIIASLGLSLTWMYQSMGVLQAAQTSIQDKPVLDTKEESRTSKKGTFQCSLIQRPELLLYIVFAILLCWVHLLQVSVCVFNFQAYQTKGWLVDWTHDFSVSFYLSGLCLVLSGVFVVLVDKLVEKKKLKLPD